MAPPLKSELHHPPFLCLRKDILHRLVDLDLAGPKFSTLQTLASQLSAATGNHVSRASLSLALSGARHSPQYVKYLSDLSNVLKSEYALPVTNITIDPLNQPGKEE